MELCLLPMIYELNCYLAKKSIIRSKEQWHEAIYCYLWLLLSDCVIHLNLNRYNVWIFYKFWWIICIPILDKNRKKVLRFMFIVWTRLNAFINWRGGLHAVRATGLNPTIKEWPEIRSGWNSPSIRLSGILSRSNPTLKQITMKYFLTKIRS